MKLFKFNGGVHPEEHKQITSAKPIRVMPMPKRLYVPLQQHIGAPAEPAVKVGDTVLKGQLLANSQGAISAPVHAPTSGMIVDISDHPAPHPSGLPVRTIVLESDGEDKWVDLPSMDADPLRTDGAEIALRVGAAGIVGMGGATFPSAVKLRLGSRNKIHMLVLNGGECEPYLTCDDRLMQERADGIVDGARIILHTIKAEKALLVVEDNKPVAIAALQKACEHAGNLRVVVVPAQYPMGSEKHMIKAVTGLEVPAGGLGADIGVLVHNMGTAYAVHQAIRHHRPLISRVITVGGGAVKEPQNVEVPIGTLLSDVIAFCGGLSEPPARTLMGGPMMGQMMPSLNVPVVKGTSGVIALTAQEVSAQTVMPCIRCGSCVGACPCGLLPLQMAAHAKAGNLDKVVDFGLVDCVSCGCCSYVCPSHIPLVQYFNYAKGEIAARQQAKHKTQENRRLVEQRTQRLEREAQLKADAAAKRKAEADARKAAQAAKAVNAELSLD
ncbi:electron transport complex, RnfABCDGE type, C subunit [Beggiatoa alba B18LD]|uniref:Ion-translocating oxidoreductase complex subunit C n=1 Tax=Beggiatoa alba B18LD TaxID=395493 RepID=I3CCB2_9GAMM|nr:electron transport complex subunit RsxC [Beggiatoa alba]EIJ41255.1 electron transport complex, RnfABCDGE type, C subunit [Beggiatoa alba B18LD]